MVGQERFKEQLNNYTRATFPHSVLLLGDEGSGHYEMCEYIANKFDLSFIDISDILTKELIDQISLSSESTLYAININKLDEPKQNALLKAYEEPNMYCYFILYGESNFNVLDTLITRSYIMNLDKFTPEMLEKLVNNSEKDYILKICNTPGQIEVANHTNITELKGLCDTIINKMSKANFSNALTIANKINFTDEYSKYDMSLFIKVLSERILSSGKYELYEPLHKVNKTIRFMNDKKRYFEQFIIKMWIISRSQNDC